MKRWKFECVALLAAGILSLTGAIAMAVPNISDSGVPKDASAEMARMFRDASQRLQKIVIAPPGSTERSQEFHRAWAAQKIAQIDPILLTLKQATSGWVKTHMPRAYREGQALGIRQAREAGVQVPGSVLQGSFSVIDQWTIQKFAMDTTMDLHKAADSMEERASHVLRRQADLGVSNTTVNRILAGGVIDGKPTQAVREFREELRKIHGDTVEISGKSFRVGYYAEMVVRTKTRAASVLARHDRLEELGLDLVRIVGRQSDNPCTEFLGHVFSLGGKHPGYPGYAELPGGGPPFHPNCSKSTAPFVESLASKAQIDRAKPDSDVGALLGLSWREAEKAYREG